MLRNNRQKISSSDLIISSLFGVPIFLASTIFSTLKVTPMGFSASLIPIMFFVPMVYCLDFLIVRKIGSLSLLGFVVGMFLVIGPGVTGFPHPLKIIAGLVSGVVADTLVFVFKKINSWLIYIIGLWVGSWIWPSNIILWWILAPNLYDLLFYMTPYMCLLGAILGFFGTIAAKKIYKRLPSYARVQ